MFSKNLNGDLKSRQMINSLCQKISNLDYCETDTLALLILMREIVEKKTSVCELAHFIAHRNRDRGHFHKYVEKCIQTAPKLINSNGRSQVKDMVRILKQNPVFSNNTILYEINEGLGSVEVPTFDSDIVSSLITSIICLLQDIKFVDKNKAEIGVTILVLTRENIALLAKIRKGSDDIVFPILSVEIDFSPIKIMDETHFGSIPNDDCVVCFNSRAGSIELDSKKSLK